MRLSSLNHVSARLTELILKEYENIIVLINSEPSIRFKDIINLGIDNEAAAEHVIKNYKSIIKLMNSINPDVPFSFYEILELAKKEHFIAEMLDIMDVCPSLSLDKIYGLHSVIKRYGYEAAYLMRENKVSINHLISAAKQSSFILKNVLQNFTAISHVLSHTNFNSLDKVFSLYESYNSWFIKNGNIYNGGLDNLPEPESIGCHLKGTPVKKKDIDSKISYKQGLCDAFYANYCNNFSEVEVTISKPEKIKFNITICCDDGDKYPILSNKYSPKNKYFEYIYRDSSKPDNYLSR